MDVWCTKCEKLHGLPVADECWPYLVARETLIERDREAQRQAQTFANDSGPEDDKPTLN